MPFFVNNMVPVLVFAVPLLLLSVGLLPSSWANAYPRTMARLNGVIAWLAFACALLAALLYPLVGVHTWSLVSVELPGDVGAFSISTYVNGVTVIMLILVSFVGAIVSRYSRNYLEGEVNQGRFHKWLSLTLATILGLIVSGNLLLFAIAWIATSLCLHQLLMFYRERPAAVLAAHKKFVASRIGDVSLIVAIFLIGSTLNTLEFEGMFNKMAVMEGAMPTALHWAAGLIVISAVLKSAQFPFHGWLIQVMEAPTPVSALLHAGIVNAGAFLIIRMSPVMSQSSTALFVLALIGLVTLALASLVMLTQTSIKVSLAWSTTAQMGFMLLECGLGLYSLAMLHLVAHSLYKAHAFLASGSGVDGFRAPVVRFSSGQDPDWRRALALIITVVVITAITAAALNQQPSMLAAAAIVAIAAMQLLLQALSLSDSRQFMLKALALTLMVCGAYFALHHLFELALTGSVFPVDDTQGTLQTVLMFAIIAVFTSLLLLQLAFKSGQPRLRNSIYVHLYNGLYIDVFITRVLQRVWPAPTKLYGG